MLGDWILLVIIVSGSNTDRLVMIPMETEKECKESGKILQTRMKEEHIKITWKCKPWSK